MKQKILLPTLLTICTIIISCGSNSQNANTTSSGGNKDTVVPPAGDDSKGYGKFKDITLTHRHHSFEMMSIQSSTGSK